MKFLGYIFLLLIMVLSGCSDQSPPGSYQSIIMVNGIEYFLTQSKGVQYDRDKEIGTIQRKVPPEQKPDTQLSSNHLAKGTKLYSTVQDSEYIIVQIPDLDEEWLYTLEKNLESVE